MFSFYTFQSSVAQWNYTFYIVAAIEVLSGLFFIAFSSADLQPWGTGDVDSSSNANITSRNPTNDDAIFIIDSSASARKPCKVQISLTGTRNVHLISSRILT